MRTPCLLSFALATLACTSPSSTPDSAEVTAPLERTRRSPALALDLLRQAEAALRGGDRSAAMRLWSASLEALDLETRTNVDWSRLELLDELAHFCHDDLKRQWPALVVARRRARAIQLLRSNGLGSLPGTNTRVRATAPDRFSDESAASEESTPGPDRGESDAQRMAETEAPSADDAAGQGQAEAEIHGSDRAEARTADSGGDAPASTPARPVPEPFTEGHPAEVVQVERRMLLIRTLVRVGRADLARALSEELLDSLGTLGLSGSTCAERVATLHAELREPERPGASGGALPGTSDTSDSATPSKVDSLGNDRDRSSGAVGGSIGIAGAGSSSNLLKALAELPTGGGGGRGSTPGSSIGALATSDGDVARALREFERELMNGDSIRGSDQDEFSAALGFTRAADEGGRAMDFVPFLEQLANRARYEFGDDHPIAHETHEHYARAVRESKGSEAEQETLESYLADLDAALGEDHAATRATRAKLAGSYSSVGLHRRAIELSEQNLRSALRTHPEGSQVVRDARERLEEVQQAAGETLTGSSDSVGSADLRNASTREEQLAKLDARALELQADCKLLEALDVRRELVDLLRKQRPAEDPARLQALRDLAALLRVLDRRQEASPLEAEAEQLASVPVDGAAPSDTESLAKPIDALVRIAAPIPAPRVELVPSRLDDEGHYRLHVEIEDPFGILRLRLQQDGLPLSRPLDEEWTLDSTGTRAHVELTLVVPDDQPVSVITASARNLRHVESRPVSIVLHAENAGESD